MGREVRRVPANWQHPIDWTNGRDGIRFRPLFDGCTLVSSLEDWDREAAAWARGDYPDYADADDRAKTYAEWNGERPDPADYMPAWSDAEATHYQMYEDTSEGTPISPVCTSPEELARWLADNRASSFGGMTATYEEWLHVCRGGFAPSLVIHGGRMMSGVEFAAAKEKRDE